MVTKKHHLTSTVLRTLSGGKRKFVRRVPGSRVAEKTLAQTRIYLPEVTPGPLARRLVKALETREN